MICIIPQHAQSVRLPRKAFREICGIPLVAWSVIQAKSAHAVDAVYVSTESQEIADICTHYGAEIIWRPEWLQNKAFSANAPITHAMQEIGIQHSHEPFLTKLATAPLLYPDDIDRVYKRFREAEEIPIGIDKQTLLAAEVQEVVAYRRVRGNHRMIMANYCNKSQPVIPFGAMNMLYADKWTEATERMHWYYEGEVTDEGIDARMVEYSLMFGNGLMYYVDCEQWQIYDIDDQGDFDICEMFMEHKILKGRGEEIYYEYARGN